MAPNSRSYCVRVLFREVGLALSSSFGPSLHPRFSLHRLHPHPTVSSSSPTSPARKYDVHHKHTSRHNRCYNSFVVSPLSPLLFLPVYLFFSRSSRTKRRLRDEALLKNEERGGGTGIRISRTTAT